MTWSREYIELLFRRHIFCKKMKINSAIKKQICLKWVDIETYISFKEFKRMCK